SVRLPSRPYASAEPTQRVDARQAVLVLERPLELVAKATVEGDAASRLANQAESLRQGAAPPIRKTFPTLAEAKAWRQESQVALRRGTLRASAATTLKEAAEDWLAAAGAGIVRTRSGDPYKPSAVRAYRQALDHLVLPRLGDKRLTAVSHLMLQDLADRLTAEGLAASIVRNPLEPLRGRYQSAL